MILFESSNRSIKKQKLGGIVMEEARKPRISGGGPFQLSLLI